MRARRVEKRIAWRALVSPEQLSGGTVTGAHHQTDQLSLVSPEQLSLVSPEQRSGGRKSGRRERSSLTRSAMLVGAEARDTAAGDEGDRTGGKPACRPGVRSIE